MTHRADVAEADAFAATTATLADAGQTETTGAEGLADLVAPHVAHGAHFIGAERGVATPRCGRRVRITRGARVEQTDHAELHRLAQSSLASDVRVLIVLRALDGVPLVGLLA